MACSSCAATSRPLQTGHLDVEERDVGCVLGDQLRGANAVFGLCDDIEVALLGEPESQLRAGRPFVVGDERADHGDPVTRSIASSHGKISVA